MKFGVITFPGSNCDQDMIYVLETILGQEVVQLWHKDHDLQGADFIVAWNEERHSVLIAIILKVRFNEFRPGKGSPSPPVRPTRTEGLVLDAPEHFPRSLVDPVRGYTTCAGDEEACKSSRHRNDHSAPTRWESGPSVAPLALWQLVLTVRGSDDSPVLFQGVPEAGPTDQWLEGFCVKKYILAGLDEGFRISQLGL